MSAEFLRNVSKMSDMFEDLAWCKYHILAQADGGE